MKFSSKIVDFLGNLVCSCFMDIFCESKMPFIVFEMSMDMMGLQGKVPGGHAPTEEVRKIKQRVRLVLLDERQNVLTKEEIAKKINDLQTKKTDVGFSYTSNGLRIVVMPEEMTLLMPGTPGVPFGTGAG